MAQQQIDAAPDTNETWLTFDVVDDEHVDENLKEKKHGHKIDSIFRV